MTKLCSLCEIKPAKYTVYCSSRCSTIGNLIAYTPNGITITANNKRILDDKGIECPYPVEKL